MEGKRQITSISAGYAIYDRLKEVMGDRLTAVIPIWNDIDAKLPYAIYYRTSSVGEPTKARTAFDTCTIVIEVYAKDYDESIELAESVRAAIEGRKLTYVDDDDPSLRLRVDCSRIVDTEEGKTNDAYLQSMTVECKIV